MKSIKTISWQSYVKKSKTPNTVNFTSEREKRSTSDKNKALVSYVREGCRINKVSKEKTEKLINEALSFKFNN